MRATFSSAVRSSRLSICSKSAGAIRRRMPPARMQRTILSIGKFHAQGVACAVINAVLNPAIAWLGNRRMAFEPLSGENSIIVDTAATCIILSLLVPLFVTPAAHRQLRAGQRTGRATAVWESSLLGQLPVNACPFE